MMKGRETTPCKVEYSKRVELGFLIILQTVIKLLGSNVTFVWDEW